MRFSENRHPALAVLAVVGATLIVVAGAHAGDDGEGGSAPDACITQSPSAPLTAQTVTFSSECSTSGGAPIASRAWDLDDDGQFDDGTGATAQRSWPQPGNYRVRLRVVDTRGEFDTEDRTVTIANRGPTAAFSFSPAEPRAGQRITLESTSSDADGSIVRHAWDLDNDRQFDDGTARTASLTPPTAGTYPVSLRVVDDRGAIATATKTFVVGDASSAQAPAAPAEPFDDSLPTSPEPAVTAPLRWLDPFPIVRIRGRTTSTGVRLNLFTVRSPAGAQINVRCRGRGCPKRPIRKVVKPSANSAVRTVRFRSLERRLGAGALLQVRVTADGVVGKYTRFKIRRLAVPARVDRCLMPGAGRPVACPR